MGSILFKVWGNLPSRSIGVAGILAPTYFAAKPTDFNKFVGAVMDPANIRFWSFVVLAVFVVYWGVYIYLKRMDDGMTNKGNGDDGNGGDGGQKSSGDHSPNLQGTFNGDVHVNSSPPSAPNSSGLMDNTEVGEFDWNNNEVDKDFDTSKFKLFSGGGVGKVTIVNSSFGVVKGKLRKPPHVK